MSDQPYRPNDRRVIRWLLLVLLVVFGGMYAATVLYTGQRIPRGTTVNEIAIGGLRPAAAEAKLSEGLGGRAAEPLTVRAAGHRATIRPTTAGFIVDVPATVARAHPRPSWDPRRVWDHFAGRRDLDAVVTVDRDRLDAAIARFADTVDDPAVDGSVRFSHGEARARYPVKGTVVDRRAAAVAVRSAFLRDLGADSVLTLPTVVSEPSLSKQAVSRAMDDFANPAMSGPVVVRLAGDGVQVDPQDFSASLSLRADGDRLRPVLDDQRLVRLLRPKMEQISRAPRDARFVVSGGRPRIVPARRGVTFRAKDVARGFLKVLTRTGSHRVLPVRGVRGRPDVTTSAARRLRITQRVSAFSTRFPYAIYRNVNLGRAASLIDGALVRPGHTFSLNATVGERTPANGFTEGYVISDGVYAKELGGGVSQVATTTFNAAFFAGMKDVEHKAHSFYIDRYPVGREATVVWPTTDLKFKNTTPYGVLVRASITKATPSRKGTMRVAMYSTKYWDISTSRSSRYDPRPPTTRHLTGRGCVPNAGYAGFDIDVYRLFHRHDSRRLDHRETLRTSYLPSDTVDCS